MKKIQNNKYKINDEIFIRSMKQSAKIIKILSNNRYLVNITSINIEVKEDDITIVPANTKNNKKKTSYPKNFSNFHNLNIKKIDLHGIHLADLKEIVLKNISDAIMQGYKQIELVHGIGDGVLKSALPKILKETSVVKSFKESSNPGIMMVYL